MLSLDANVLIGVLIFVAMVVYILVLRKLRPESGALRHVSRQETKEPDSKKMKKENIPEKENSANVHSKSGSTCPHHFGYLRTLPKNSSLPDECLGCPKLVSCLTKVSTNKYGGKYKLQKPR